MSPFWHLMGEIQPSASELKLAVNVPLKDNGTGHLPRGHSTGRALFRIISFQKWKRMLCIFYSDTETWKGNFIFVEKPRCSCLQHQRNKWWAFLPSQAVPLTPQNTPKLSGITTEVISSIFHSKTLTGLYIGDTNAGLILTERETKISKTHIYDWYSATQKPTNTKKQTKKTPPKPPKPRPPQKTPNQPTKNQIKKEPTKKIHLHGCLLDLLFALEKLLARK